MCACCCCVERVKYLLPLLSESVEHGDMCHSHPPGRACSLWRALRPAVTRGSCRIEAFSSSEPVWILLGRRGRRREAAWQQQQAAAAAKKCASPSEQQNRRRQFGYLSGAQAPETRHKLSSTLQAFNQTLLQPPTGEPASQNARGVAKRGRKKRRVGLPCPRPLPPSFRLDRGAKRDTTLSVSCRSALAAHGPCAAAG